VFVKNHAIIESFERMIQENHRKSPIIKAVYALQMMMLT